MSESPLERYHRRRSEWMESKGGKCVKCGSADNLEIDHIDPATKSYAVAEILAGGYEDVVQAELAKCQPLCHDCHQSKTREEFGQNWLIHGTRSMYNKHGCRCTECRAWNRERVRAQRKNKN